MLEYKGYHATIQYDAEDKIFVGEVFGIADSLNFHGTSVSKLQDRGTFNVRILPKLHKRAALEAAKQNITLNQYVVKAIEQSF